MRTVKCVLLAVAIALLFLFCVSCAGGEGSSASTPTSSTTSADVYEAVEVFKSDTGKTADGFRGFGEGDIVLENGCMTVDNGMGAYHVEDSELVLTGDKYKLLTISFDITFDKFPETNGMAIISPLFWVEDAIKYQVFLRVNSRGKLGYHANGRWIQDIIVDGDPLYIREGVEYGIEIVYDIEYGSYSIYIDGELVEDDILEYMMDETVTRFTVRFLDNNTANGPCTVRLENVKIIAEP